MEMSKLEVAVMSDVTIEANDAQMAELAEFQLAFIGGGVGEVVLS